MNSSLDIMKPVLQKITGCINNYESGDRKYRSGYRNALLLEINNLKNGINNISKEFNKINKAVTELQNLEQKVAEVIPAFYSYLFNNINKILSGNNTEEISYINNIIQNEEVEYYITTGIILKSINQETAQVQKQFFKELNNINKPLNKNAIANKYIQQINQIMKKYYDEIEQFKTYINNININNHLNYITISLVKNIQQKLNEYLNNRRNYIKTISEQTLNHIMTNIA